MKCSDAGIEFIKDAEGYRATAYDDVVGKKTIGYGHLIRAGEKFVSLDKAQATALLCKDLEACEACIEANVDVTLTQGQFDALASLVFNIGCTRFLSSTLFRYLNKNQMGFAAEEFPKWNKAGGVPVAGLTRRRLGEQALFNGTERA